MSKLASEAAVLAALRKRFAAPAWALLEHVRNGTGFDRKVTRTADAIAMSLWPSRGLELHGFEVKVSRADLVKELATPEKAEEICRFCDRWWLVVGDAEIVKPGELPPTWGLIVPRGDQLISKVEAPKLQPQPIDRLFLAALLRKTTEISADEKWLKEQVDLRVEAEQAKWRDAQSWELEQTKRSFEHYKKAIADFEQASGVTIDTWDGGRIGEAVEAVMRGEHLRFRQRLQQVQEMAQRLSEQAAKELATLDSTPTKSEAAS